MSEKGAKCNDAMHAECKKGLRGDFPERKGGPTCNFEKGGGLNAILQNAGFKMQFFKIDMRQDMF